MMTRNRRTAIGFAVLMAVLLADQASKWWVLHVIHLREVGQITLLPVLDLTMVWNHGVTFGLLNGFGSAGPILLGGVALAVVAALVVWMRRADSLATAIAVGAVAGGAIGNVADRARFGAVVDFIHAHWGGWSWYVFNVGDAAICLGVAALMIEGLASRPRRPDLDRPDLPHPDRIV